MWPFGHTEGVSRTEREPELSSALKARLDELEERSRKTEKAMNALELDWSEWFNKFRLLYARLTKRVNDEAQKSLDDRAGDENGTKPSPHVGYGHAQLHPQPRRRTNY